MHIASHCNRFHLSWSGLRGFSSPRGFRPGVVLPSHVRIANDSFVGKKTSQPSRFSTRKVDVLAQALVVRAPVQKVQR